jgi:hypothetical protein
VTARSKQLKDLAAQAKRLLASAKTVTPATARKLSAIVKTADTLKLARRSGPLSLATAGVLIGEGAYARFALGKQIDNETAAEVVHTTGTATAVAGTSLVAKRLMARATSLALPDAKAISMLEQARAVSSPALKAAEKTVAKKLAIKAGAKLLGGPLAMAFAAVDAIEGYQKDGLRGAILNAGTLGLYEGLKDARKVAKIQTRIVQHTMHTSPMMAKLRAAYHRGSGHPGQASLTSSNAPATVIVHEHRRKGASGKSETVRQYTRRAPGR